MTEHIWKQFRWTAGLALGLVALVAGFTDRIPWTLLLGAGLYIIATVLAELEKGEK